YSVALALLAALGYMALAAGVAQKPAYAAGFAKYGPNYAVPALYLDQFPDWFVGLAFAAIAIGTLAPAAIMSIAAANLFTRNIYREYFRPTCTEREESNVAKTASLLVKVGALAFILFFPTELAINLQLLSNIWIVQTLPTVFLALYTTWFHRKALAIGWGAGMIVGTALMLALHFQSSVFPISLLGV